LEEHAEALSHIVEFSIIQPGNVHALNQDFSLIRSYEPNHMFEKNAFASAALADNNRNFSGFNLKVQAI
jgi:hypothetical protein